MHRQAFNLVSFTYQFFFFFKSSHPRPNQSCLIVFFVEFEFPIIT
jgi:hypothetical protein